jgi:hypothetical protein
MRNLLFVILTLGLFSCNSDEEECCRNIEADLQISIINNEDVDLLNPLNGEINIDNFKLYYKNQLGNLILFNKPNLDNPKGFELVNPENNGNQRFSINLFLNTEYLVDNTSFTVISWNNEKKYEIKTIFLKDNNSLIADKIFIDNELIIDSGENRFTTITEL